jgi:ABC-type transporter Mla subunit MlaD
MVVQFILEFFTSEKKAEEILSSPLIEIIFLVLIVGFVLTLFVHLILFSKLRRLRNYVVETNRMDIEPLASFQKQFETIQQEDSVAAETFVQERFSSWKVFGIPVISLIKLIQMTVSVFILIGVLGTFIGLTISLGSIRTTGEQLVENITAVLTGIDVAFYTSIAGMSFSLIMTVLLKALNTEHMLTDIMLKVESNLEGKNDHNLSRLIHVSEQINESIISLTDTNRHSLGNIEKAFAGFQEYTTGLQQSAKDLAQFNEGLSQNLVEFNTLFTKMKVVTDGFGEGTARLNDNFDSLFTYFQNMDENQEKVVQIVEGTYDKMKEVSDTQLQSQQQVEKVVTDLKQFTSSLLQVQKNLQETFVKIVHQSNQLVQRMDLHNKEFKQIFGSDLSSRLAGITTYLGELSQDFDRLGEAISDLPEALQVINHTQTEYRHLLTDRFEELKHFNRTFSNHLKEHTTDSLAFERHLREATKTFELVGSKNSQLMQEIDSKIARMSQVYNQRENQLENSVNVLKDTFANYVANLENTFGNRLEQVGRTISDSMDNTMGQMKREFMEIRRITEQLQQNNSQYTQQMLQELGRELQSLIRQINVVSQPAPSRQTGIGMNQNGY